MGSLFLPRLLFADDTSLFGEDVGRLKQSLMVLEEWCSRWRIKIPMVTKYKYLGCVIYEFLELNSMVDDRAEAGRRAMGSLLQGARSAVGVLYGCTFKQLLDSMVQSELLYGAEAWGCLRSLESCERVQLRALQFYFGVPRSHPGLISCNSNAMISAFLKY